MKELMSVSRDKVGVLSLGVLLPLLLVVIVDNVPRFVFAACPYYTCDDTNNFSVVADPLEISLNETSSLATVNAACPCSWQISSQPGGWTIDDHGNCTATLRPITEFGSPGEITVLVTSDQCQDSVTITAGCFNFRVQASIDGGDTWHDDSVLVKGNPGQEVDVAVRTVLTATSGQTEGWSYSVKHDASVLEASGGDLEVVQTTTSGTHTPTLQDGAGPDFEETQARVDSNASSLGYTQGVVVDDNVTLTLDPVVSFVTAGACYRIAMPDLGSYSVDLALVDDIGDGEQPIETVIVQDGESIYPCLRDFTLSILSTDTTQSPTPACWVCDTNGCTIPPSQTWILPGDGGPGPGGSGTYRSLVKAVPDGGGAGIDADFIRGDANNDGLANISDVVFILQFLFLSATSPTCVDAADVDDDGRKNITDTIFLLIHLFLGGTEPPPPFPICGTDPTADELDCMAGWCDEDADGDGVTNGQELAQADNDGDGLTNEEEVMMGTNPNSADTDGDGLNDNVETNTGNFVDANDTGTDPNDDDSDNDGLSDGVETNTGIFISANDTGTNPNDDDTDNDQLEDGFEVGFVGSDPTDADTDRDGFNDGEEQTSSGPNGLNLLSLGADALRPNVFVEIDWFELVSGPNPHSHKPRQEALQAVVDAFDRAPVRTVVGGQEKSIGITLHIGAGPELTINLDPTDARGNAIVFSVEEDERFVSPDGTPQSFLSGLDGFMNEHFESNRSGVFHYSLWGHFLWDLSGEIEFVTGGVSPNTPGQEFVVSLGGPFWPEYDADDNGTPGQLQDTILIEGGLFMHELGHNLGLRHGGDADLPECKPNHLSVVNPRYAIRGVGDCNHKPSRSRLDYSSFVELCNNMEDDNGDGLVDLDDPQCPVNQNGEICDNRLAWIPTLGF